MNIIYLINKYKIIAVRGLTLLETLVSILIISLTIIGPLAFIATSSSYARQTKEAILATYLAEEAVELLQNHYDSLYIRCSKQFGIEPCTTSLDETTSQVAWRVFKERFSTTAGLPSCFIDENPEGCSFDYINMQADITNQPEHYDALSDECPQIVATKISGVTSYVCKGLLSHVNGGTQGLLYRRVVYLEHLPTFDISPRNEQDNDDIRITSEVFYRAVNGSSRSVKVIRYLHPRP